MTEDADVIQHLLEVEREASTLLLDAQKEADKKNADARARAETQFKNAYSAIAATIEADEVAAKKSISQKHDKDLAAYRDGLHALEKDTDACNTLLDSFLSA
ncbi:MAG: hypothetical protein J1D88_02415 [Treponema sp.]|nr:hypothetical protein [Treponema sp.]